MHGFSALLVIASAAQVAAQLDVFALPQGPQYAPKPTVPPELRSYFELDGHARELMDSLLGPRPGGLFPEKTYEIGTGDNGQPQGKTYVPSNLERTLESFFTAPENPGAGAFPPGFGGSGFSLQNNNHNLASVGNVRRAPVKKPDEIEGSGEEKSSIAGIPKMPLTKIPMPPLSDIEERFLKPQRRVASDVPLVPSIRTAPEIPEGGMLPSDIRRSPENVGEVAQSIDGAPEGVNTAEYGGLSEETSTSSGGLIGTILNLITLGSKKATEAAKKNQTAASPEDRNALGKAVSNLIGGENSPLPGKSMISNVLYKALTAGSVQNNETSDGNSTFVLTSAQSAAIGENLELVKNLIIQQSPLCTQKPEVVEFDIDSFMGQWYQVIYSPVLSQSTCSMMAYKKLSSVNDGGVGSIFEIFEYATDGTPYGKPKISSGYAIIKQPGELIYRTTSAQEDVTVRVLALGPVSNQNEYEYVVMSTNCNYPIYVYARDPITFKQKYEVKVNKFLEQKGLVNGFSRLLNIVSPVDNTMCTFPPSLFNMGG